MLIFLSFTIILCSQQPTNHLDITSKEVLEEALLNYAGSVVLISHDRYFMSQVANTIFSFHDQGVERFDCDYHDYLNRLQDQQQAREEAKTAEETLATLRGLPEHEQSALDADTLRRLREADPATTPPDEILALARQVATSPGTDPATSAALSSKIDAQVYGTEMDQSRSSKSRPAATTLKDKVTSRYVDGDKYKITHAKEVLATFGDEELKKKKKNFGGSGVTCGNLNKGIKNAKRFNKPIQGGFAG